MRNLTAEALQGRMLEAAAALSGTRTYDENGRAMRQLSIREAMNMIEYHRPAKLLEIMKAQKLEQEWWWASLHVASMTLGRHTQQLSVAPNDLPEVYHTRAERAFLIYNGGRPLVGTSACARALAECGRDLNAVRALVAALGLVVAAMEAARA